MPVAGAWPRRAGRRPSRPRRHPPKAPADSSCRGYSPLYDRICRTVAESDEVLDPTSFVIPSAIDNLKVVPADGSLTGAEIELVGLTDRERRLRRLLEPLRADFDWIFIDCPPSLGLLTLNALVAADAVLIPLNCEYFALEGLADVSEAVIHRPVDLRRLRHCKPRGKVGNQPLKSESPAGRIRRLRVRLEVPVVVPRVRRFRRFSKRLIPRQNRSRVLHPVTLPRAVRTHTNPVAKT
jgi:cellulose biosynthesis protein BcsQ